MHESLDSLAVPGSSMYREHILDQYRNPRNRGVLPSPDVSLTQNNPLCGDEVTISFTLDSKGRIKEIAFMGHGCAISQAAASLLTEAVKGKTVGQVKAMTAEDMLNLLHIPLGPVRMKCALLPLRILERGIHEYEARQAKKKVKAARQDLRSMPPQASAYRSTRSTKSRKREEMKG